MPTIAISHEDVDALARTAMSEVGHFGRHGEATLKGGVEAVVDTILNRVAHPSYGDGVEEVVDARFQFSAIGGPGGVKTWRRLPKASDRVATIVSAHLKDRLGGKACTVKGAQHFLNPHFSSPKALRSWGNHVVQHAVAAWGKGRDIHFHGFAPNSSPPPAYRLEMDSKAREFTGKGERASAGTNAAPNEPDATESGVTFLEPEQDETPAYRVEEVASTDVASLQAALNGCSAEGWRLRQILPVADKLLIVLEGDAADELVHEGDDRSDDEALAAPPVVLDSSPEARFARFFAGLRIRHFKPHEFLVMGAQHHAVGRAQGKNTLPPEELWASVKPTALVLEKLCDTLGASIRLSSVYRSPAYNALLSGAASGSMHMQFNAADFTCADGQGPVWWAKKLKGLRDAGLFEGGIGVYPTFVHVDTRGKNAKFGPWLGRVFG